jgi:hypothetical protein
MSDRAKYLALCAEDASIPVFSQPWWLDAVCGPDAWNVALVEERGAIAAAMPYHLTRRMGFRIINMPPMTQVLGPHLVRRDFPSHQERLSVEKQLFAQLIAQLPVADYTYIQMHYRYTNWLPFFWAGFTQTTRYTYVIPDLSDLALVVKRFDYSKKKHIRKSSGQVKVSFDVGAEEFYSNHKLTLRKQGKNIFYSQKLFERMHSAVYANASGRTIGARDAAGNLHAALFVIWAPEGAYDLISTIDPDYRSSGAATLLVHDVIRHVAAFTNRFDFEGSMGEGVESSFRRFGSVQMPYSAVKHVRSPILRLREGMLTAFSERR